jgi:hypothetical protein
VKGKKKVDPRIIGAAVAAQVVVGGLTVRDISRRQPGEIRGPRLLWKIWGGTNAFGSLVYWLVGRRRGAAGEAAATGAA